MRVRRRATGRAAAMGVLLLAGSVVAAEPPSSPLRADPARLARAPAKLQEQLRGDPFTYFKFVNTEWAARVCEAFRRDLPSLPTAILHGDAHVGHPVRRPPPRAGRARGPRTCGALGPRLYSRRKSQVSLYTPQVDWLHASGDMDWIFAYGSLMGDALLSRCPARPARLPGYHRAFTHESERRWGQPAQPCPVVGLASGGECWGLAFEIPSEERGSILRALQRREGASERRCLTLEVETPGGTIEARVWVSANGPGGDPGPDLLALETRLRAAHGVVGNGTEYVRTLVHALELHGLNDPLVDALWARLRG